MTTFKYDEDDWHYNIVYVHWLTLPLVVTLICERAAHVITLAAGGWPVTLVALLSSCGYAALVLSDCRPKDNHNLRSLTYNCVSFFRLRFTYGWLKHRGVTVTLFSELVLGSSQRFYSLGFQEPGWPVIVKILWPVRILRPRGFFLPMNLSLKLDREWLLVFNY